MDNAIKRLKEKDVVLTSQRIAMLEMIKKKKEHLTAEEVYKKEGNSNVMSKVRIYCF